MQDDVLEGMAIVAPRPELPDPLESVYGPALSPRRLALWVSAAEVEMLLSHALVSPLPFGPDEEALCAKLRRCLEGLYVWRDPLPQ